MAYYFSLQCNVSLPYILAARHRSVFLPLLISSKLWGGHENRQKKAALVEPLNVMCILFHRATAWVFGLPHGASTATIAKSESIGCETIRAAGMHGCNRSKSVLGMECLN